MQVQSTVNKKIHRFVLDNGITVISVENQAADIIAGRIFLKNTGAIMQEAKKAGLSQLVATIMTKGTENLSSLEIAEAVESIGASLGAEASNDYFLVSLKTIASDFPQILKLAGEILRSPSFPEPEIELEKYLTQQNIRSQKEVPFNIAFNQLREAIYENHPYGFSIFGTEETVAKIFRDDLVEYHQSHFRPDNLVISLSGRLEPEEAVKLVEEVFGNWYPPSTPPLTPQLPRINSQPTEKFTYQDSQQTIIMLGYLGCEVKHPDYAGLKLISTYLGNGLSSRLFVELREKMGLAYDVSAFYPTRLDKSPFVVYIGTAPENTAIALEGLNREVERLSQIELSLEELQGAKNKLLGQYALGKQTNGEIAQTYGWYETLELGIEFDEQFPEKITQITPEIVQKLAQKYLTNPYISIVGQEDYPQEK